MGVDEVENYPFDNVDDDHYINGGSSMNHNDSMNLANPIDDDDDINIFDGAFTQVGIL